MNNRIVKFIAPIILLIAGVVFTFLGVKNLSDIKTFDKIPAVVVSIDRQTTTDADGNTTTDETAYVDYTYNGKEYKSVALQFSPGGLERGDEITVLCNPDKPDYVSGATKTSSIIQIVIGAIGLLAGIITGFIALIRR